MTERFGGNESPTKRTCISDQHVSRDMALHNSQASSIRRAWDVDFACLTLNWTFGGELAPYVRLGILTPTIPAASCFSYTGILCTVVTTIYVFPLNAVNQLSNPNLNSWAVIITELTGFLITRIFRSETHFNLRYSISSAAALATSVAAVPWNLPQASSTSFEINPPRCDIFRRLSQPSSGGSTSQNQPTTPPQHLMCQHTANCDRSKNTGDVKPWENGMIWSQKSHPLCYSKLTVA